MSAGRAVRGLTGKLALLVVTIAVGLALFFWGVVGPRTAAAVAEGTEPLVRRMAERMRTNDRAQARDNSAVLSKLIEHTAAARRAALADLPLDLYDGDPARIAAAIERHDAALSRRLSENVARLTAELEARVDRHVEAEAVTMVREQRELAAVVAADLQRSSWVLLGGALAVVLVLLGVGLHRLVVRPVRALQQAALAVTEGRLNIDLDARGADEVAHLTRAFAAMVRELRASRAELESKRTALAELNANLETEVAKKTAALQQALDGLRSTQKDLVLAERMASVGTLAGGIAHEFNNLAGGIRGCAREMLANEADPARREPLEVIVRAAERAIDVTDKLLRFARPRPPGAAVLDLAPLLREAVALVEPQARQQNVATRVETAGGLRVRGDGGALHQVFVNLLGNALQAMPGGGDLAVRGVREGDQVVVTVRDTGSGIATGDLDRIFDPFFTTRGADAATPGRGAGLGLAVSYGIVQAHGGRMQVDSTPRVGTTFSVRLPAARADGSPAGEGESA